MASQSDTDPAAENARLRAERDQLQTQVETMQRRSRQRGRVRRVIVVALVVLTGVSLVAGVVGVWARRNFLDTERFVDRVGPLVEEPAVQETVSARLTEQIMTLVDPRALFEEALPERGQVLAAPLANAVGGFVRERVDSFVQSDRFERLWVGAATVAHQAAVRVLSGEGDAVTTANGQITLNLVPVINEVLERITATSPEILGREVNLPDLTVDDIPEAAIARMEDALGVDLGSDFGQITVYDDGRLQAVQDAIELADRLVVVLVFVAIVSAALALWLSTRRRRTLLQISAAVAIGMVLIRRVSFRVDDEIAALPPTPEGRGAAAVAIDQFLDPLLTFAMWTLAATAIVAALAVLTGDYPWVVSLRRHVRTLSARAIATTGERAHDEASIAWISDHRDALLIAGAIGALIILWVADLSWIPLLLVLALVAAFEATVYRIGTHPATPPP